MCNTIGESDEFLSAGDLAAAKRADERCGAITVIVIGVILILASLVVTGLYLSHQFPTVFGDQRYIFWIVGPPGIGGSAFLCYGMHQLKQNAEPEESSAILPTSPEELSRRASERFGATSVIAVGIILMLASLVMTGLYLSHHFPIFNDQNSIGLILGPPGIGGLALFSYGMYKLKQNAELVHRTWQRQAADNIRLLMKHHDLDPSRFEVIGDEGVPRIETIGIFHYALRCLIESQEEDRVDLRWALDQSVGALNTLKEHDAILAADYKRCSETSPLFQSLTVEAESTLIPGVKFINPLPLLAGTPREEGLVASNSPVRESDGVAF